MYMILTARSYQTYPTLVRGNCGSRPLFQESNMVEGGGRIIFKKRYKAVLGIRDILVRIRIQNPGSVLLDYRIRI
jgi:hypothetical protein